MFLIERAAEEHGFEQQRGAVAPLMIKPREHRADVAGLGEFGAPDASGVAVAVAD